MTVDLSKLDAANKALQADTKAARSTRQFGQAVADVLHAMNPAPPPSSSAAGLYQLGGSLGKCSHLTDGTYATVIGDWTDTALLAKVSGTGFLYTVTAATTTDPQYVTLDTANPQAYITKVLGAAVGNGVRGVFLDNCVASIPGLAGALVLVSSSLRAAGVKFAANVGNYVPGDPGSDDGTLWMQWAQTIAPSLDFAMLENWMQFSGGPLLGQLRTDMNGGNKSGWQRCPGSLPAGCRFMAVTYGPPAPGTTADAAAYGKAALLASPGVRPDAAYVYSTPGTDPFGPWAQA